MFELNFSIFPLLLVVGLGAIAIGIVSLIKKYFPMIAQKYRPNKPFRQTWLYNLELLGVVTLLAIFIGFLYKRNTLIALALTVVLIMVVYYISSYFLKNYLSGLLIKSSGQYRVGDILLTESHKGKISRLGNTHIRINNAEGQRIYIPYSWIYPRLKITQQPQDKVNGYSFSLSVNPKSIEGNTPEQIKQLIEQTPWVHPAFEPEIELLKSSESKRKYKITVYALSTVYHQKIEHKVKKQYQN